MERCFKKVACNVPKDCSMKVEPTIMIEIMVRVMIDDDVALDALSC